MRPPNMAELALVDPAGFEELTAGLSRTAYTALMRELGYIDMLEVRAPSHSPKPRCSHAGCGRVAHRDGHCKGHLELLPF